MCCGTLNDTFYVKAEVQLKDILNYAQAVTPEFICKLALYASKVGKMRATSALLTTLLAVRDPALFEKNAAELLDFRALRTFVKIIRSNVLGRKSFGSRLRRVINTFLENRTEYELLMGNIGNDPSLADIIKMTHPKPASQSVAQLFNWFVDSKKVTESHPLVADLNAFTRSLESTTKLSKIVAKVNAGPVKSFTKAQTDEISALLQAGSAEAAQQLTKDILDQNAHDFADLLNEYNTLKAYGDVDVTPDLPNVPFEMLKTLKLRLEHWDTVVRRMSYNQLRKSIVTIANTGVLKDPVLSGPLKSYILDRLSNLRANDANRFKPMDLVTTICTLETKRDELTANIGDITFINGVINTLAATLEFMLEKAPKLQGGLLIAVDCSGSMQQVIGGNTSSVMRLTAAAILAAGLWKANPNAVFAVYGTNIGLIDGVSPLDSLSTIVAKIKSYNHGSTNTHLVFESAEHFLKTTGSAFANIVVISDNESWSTQTGFYHGHLMTKVNSMGAEYVSRNLPVPKIFNIDVDPNAVSHVPSSKNIFNIGGMDDYVFDIIDNFAKSEVDNSKDFWVEAVHNTVIKV